jgi:Bacterial PH domain
MPSESDRREQPTTEQGVPLVSAWAGRCRAGLGVAPQYDQIAGALMPGETIYAVYDAMGVGTGFIGLTNKRAVFQDKVFVGKKVAITSLPYRQIAWVSMVSNKSWAGSFFSTGHLAIKTAGGDVHEIEFRGNEKAHHCHNLILHHIL